MSADRLEHSKELLRRLVISYWDLDQAKQFARQILIREWRDDSDEVGEVLHRALNTALLIAYSRPFTQNDRGRRGAVGTLPEKIVRVFGPGEAAFHKKIVGPGGLRNSVYAHSDSESHGLKIRVADVGGMPWAIPTKHDPFAPLPKAKVELLDRMIDKLTARTLEEKQRIQSTLPFDARF